MPGLLVRYEVPVAAVVTLAVVPEMVVTVIWGGVTPTVLRVETGAVMVMLAGVESVGPRVMVASYPVVWPGVMICGKVAPKVVWPF